MLTLQPCFLSVSCFLQVETHVAIVSVACDTNAFVDRKQEAIFLIRCDLSHFFLETEISVTSHFLLRLFFINSEERFKILYFAKKFNFLFVKYEHHSGPNRMCVVIVNVTFGFELCECGQ